jgi:phosphatidylserine/phosphatidylglycerophosphate/cardiolipin synthase-like enzyme
MYDPIQNDNYNEWIELYNPTNKTINISSWSISDNYAEDLIENDGNQSNNTLMIPPFSYAIIADHGTKIYENFSIPNSTIKLYVDDKSIGNGLGNSGDKLILKNSQNQTIDTIEWIKNYTDIPGTPANKVKEGYSLSRHKNFNMTNSSIGFYEAIIPTPGSSNIFLPGNHKILINKTKTYFYIEKNKATSIPIQIKNSGFFTDNITLNTSDLTKGWNVYLEQKKITLKPNETKNFYLKIIPHHTSICLNGKIKIHAISEKDFGIPDEITIKFEKIGSDLTIRNIKIYDEEDKQKNIFGQGEIIRIKSFLKNYGNRNASNVNVRLYYDRIKETNLIGIKNYESVSKYQKYPSIKWDTTNIEPGNHTIIVIADKNDIIEELDETNNLLTIYVNIINTAPSKIGKKIIISEIYYHSHPGLYNEFIKIYNPSMEDYDISGFYITNTPFKRKTDQTKIIFPKNTTISGKTSIIIAENTETYLWEVGEKPDFEYNKDTDNNTSQMDSSKKFIMSNKGCSISLKNNYNYTIDLVSYGNITTKNISWNGEPIPLSGEGIILKRNYNNNGSINDTNTLDDWSNPRKYRIGQSDFSPKKINFFGEIRAFVSPDNSYDAIVCEIRKANRSIFLNIYEFTNPFLCDEIVNALRRNVIVKIFLEGSPVGGLSDEEKYILNRIATYGGDIRLIVNDKSSDVYARYPFNHAKYLIIDNNTVIVESCNWAKTGVPKNPSYGNREWGVVIRNSDVAEYFMDVFNDDFDQTRCDSVSFFDLNFSISSDFLMDYSVYRGDYYPQFDSFSFNQSFSVIPVFSPDTSFDMIYEMINSATKSIYIQQLYIYKNWSDMINPFVDLLVKKSKQGVDIKVILNYNPSYKSTNYKCNDTKQYFKKYGIETRFIFSNSSCLINVHNKGIIVDNKSVLISSINWNENSFTNNREAGVIIDSEELAEFYANVFLYDWNLEYNTSKYLSESISENFENNYNNTIYIIIIYSLTFGLVARDWRKRKWT